MSSAPVRPIPLLENSGAPHLLRRSRLTQGCAALVLMAVVPLGGSVRAAAPVVTIGPGGVKIQVASASLSDAIDALARAANFKVTYEGPRPRAMLFNAEIDTPSIGQALVRLLDGQNLNYGVVFDPTGRKVTSLMILGIVAKTGGPSSGAALGPRTPVPGSARPVRNDLPPVDDDPQEPSPPEAAVPVTTPSPAPSASPATPSPPSPFGPRSPFGNPFGPRPTPTPSP